MIPFFVCMHVLFYVHVELIDFDNMKQQKKEQSMPNKC